MRYSLEWSGMGLETGHERGTVFERSVDGAVVALKVLLIMCSLQL